MVEPRLRIGRSGTLERKCPASACRRLAPLNGPDGLLGTSGNHPLDVVEVRWLGKVMPEAGSRGAFMVLRQ
jgi:hypothetical protein